MRRAAAIALLTALGLALFLAPAAHASCVQPPPLEQVYADAEVVFRGTVTVTESRDRIATVRVDEVWKGPPLPGVVEVRGGPSDDNVASSVDRGFEVGVQYLFFPENDGPPFRDNICTATQRYRASLESLRSPAQQGDDGGAPLPFTGAASLLVWLLAAWLLMGSVLAFLLLSRRRRDPRWGGGRR